ncbi:MAG: hypothetical protein H7832_02410 [Magnetococcus sp. DMHC-6]
MKQNCWEIAKCGREMGGAKVNELGICPASSDTLHTGKNGGKNGGRSCWSVSGTLCKGIITGTFAQKKATCLDCHVFRLIRDEEGEQFVLF